MKPSLKRNNELSMEYNFNQENPHTKKQKASYEQQENFSSIPLQSNIAPTTTSTTNTVTTTTFPSIDILRCYEHGEVIALLKQVLPPSTVKLFIEKEIQNNDYYPSNALNGSHLLNAIYDYDCFFDSNYTILEAFQQMVEELRSEGKITDEGVAKSVAYWLVDNYTNKMSSSLHSNRNITKDEIFHFIKLVLNQLPLQPYYDGGEVEQTKLSFKESASIIVNGFGSDFKFIGRSDVLENVTSGHKRYLKAIIDGRDLEIPFIAAAPGIGKSRILKEIGLLFNTTYNYVPLFTSFGNETKIESSIEGTNPVNSLCVRIIYSLLLSLGIKANKNLNVFRYLVDKWNVEFGKRDVLFIDEILAACKKLISPDREINFFLGIDEAQEIDSKGYHSPFDRLASDIASYMQEPTCGILYPLFVGTNFKGISRGLSESGCLPNFIPVSVMLPTLNLFQIIDGVALKYGKLKDWRSNVDFKHYLRTIGGYARGIEYYLDHLFTIENSVPKEAWKIAKDNTPMMRLVSSSSVSSQVRTIIFNSLNTRRKIEINEEVEIGTTWSDLEERGLIMLEPITTTYSLTGNIKAVSLEGHTATCPPYIFSDLKNIHLMKKRNDQQK